jgi:hypothetical protein
MKDQQLPPQQLKQYSQQLPTQDMHSQQPFSQQLPPQIGYLPQPPYYNQPVMNVASPQKQAKKSRRWLWITLTIIGIIGLLSFGLSAFISMAAKSATPPNAVSTNGSLQTRGTTTTTNTMTRTTPATIANVGQTITVQNISCVLVFLSPCIH